MKILVVDDHSLVREGLSQVLKGLDEDVEVLGAADCAAAFEVAALNPDLDLVLLDYQLPDMNGLDALDIFGENHPELPVVMLSGTANRQRMQQALNQGAAGFVGKTGASQDLLQALRQVLDGGVHIPPELLHDGDLPEVCDTTIPDADRQLTPRQANVLHLLLDGRSTRDISKELFLAEETVKTHISAIIHAFGVKTRLQAVLAAPRFGYNRSARSG